MSRRRAWSRLTAVVGVLAVLATGCTEDGEPGEEESVPEAAPSEEVTGADDEVLGAAGGEYCAGAGERDLVWAHAEEPPDLHVDDPANLLGVTSWIRQSLLEGLYGVNSSIEFVPELLAEDATVTELDDGRVRLDYRLRDGLRWSDGEPLTAEDVVNTYEIIMEGYDPATGEGATYLMTSRQGYDRIDPESWEVTSDTEFSFEMTEFFAGYPGLFDTVFPAHVVPDAETANAAWREFTLDGEPVPSSGPMIFESWDRGVEMQLVRNEQYHGAHPENGDIRNQGLACVPGVTISFVDPATALRAGEADFIMANPQVVFADQISADERFTAASVPGPAFEQLALNLENEHLADPLVREALAYAIDKSELMARLYTPLFGEALDPEGLGNPYWLTGEYEVDHQAAYAGAQIDEARARLEEAGYTLNPEGVYEHPERGPLTLRISTTADDELRIDQQTVLVEQARAAGIDLQIDNLPFPAFFQEKVFSPESIACTLSGGEHGVVYEGPETEGEVTSDCHTFDIAMFSWLGGPWPGGQHVAYLSDSPNNLQRFLSEAWDERARECDATVDEEERAACYNELARWVTTLEIDPEQGLATIPLTTKPYYFAYSNERLAAAAIASDANMAGPLAYVVDFKPVS